jgi:ferredoxin
MANPENRVSENVAGEYYVDDQCIACGICVGEAPDNFEMGADYAYVSKQPENEAEETACDSALAACPVDAIGSDV